MARNAGVGTRDMASAGRMLLDRERARGNVSFSTAASVSMAWTLFVRFVHAEGVRRLEHVTYELLVHYGMGLAQQVVRDECAAGHAQRLVSAVNTVMRLATKNWHCVRPVQDCGIPMRVAVRREPPSGIDPDVVERAVQSLLSNQQEAAVAVVRLCWSLGLRIKEAALLNAKSALCQAQTNGRVDIKYGTKGGRTRVVPIAHEHQLVALRVAAMVQRQGRCVIPPELDWQEFRNSVLNQARATLKACGVAKFHDLRAAYACLRYLELTGNAAPVLTGGIVDRQADQNARAEIASELGHNRVNVVSAYVGGVA